MKNDSPLDIGAEYPYTVMLITDRSGREMKLIIDSEDAKMRFEGDVGESAKTFFDEVLKQHIPKHVKSKPEIETEVLEHINRNRTISCPLTMEQLRVNMSEGDLRDRYVAVCIEAAKVQAESDFAVAL